MRAYEPLLAPTPLLNFNQPSISQLIEDRGWKSPPMQDRNGPIYDVVRNEIASGNSCANDIAASKVLSDGYGQCNTKSTLLMAQLRGVGIQCRLLGFTNQGVLQRGVMPVLAYPIAPADIDYSWVEMEVGGGWFNLKGFILDTRFLASLQRTFSDEESFCCYGAGTYCLGATPVGWTGSETYIQKTGIASDFGIFSSPEKFYGEHRQAFGPVQGWLNRHVVRHCMNARVRAIRAGRVPQIPDVNRTNHRHMEYARAT